MHLLLLLFALKAHAGQHLHHLGLALVPLLGLHYPHYLSLVVVLRLQKIQLVLVGYLGHHHLLLILLGIHEHLHHGHVLLAHHLDQLHLAHV